ncbi:Ltp family lipoprotein [Cellulosimicrobium terreum]|nr:Ltp family lipoprotein [Cellulosimicrobium terreum]
MVTGAGVVVLLVVAIAALNGGNDEARDNPVAVAADTQDAQENEEAAEETVSEEQAEAERLAEKEEEAAAKAEEEEKAAAKAEEERVAEEERLAEEAAAAAEEARIGTVAQQNAYQSAVDYLDYTAFSRSGLVDQLEFEEFSTADAEFAVARLEAEGGVDWNEQAAASAADYLDYTSFSRSGLIDQLLFEGFTAEQAEYGVSKTGL